MYNCDTCCKTTAPREPLHRIVVEKRPMTYYNAAPMRDDDDDRPRGGGVSQGWEIVKEAKVCKACVPAIPAIHG